MLLLWLCARYNHRPPTTIAMIAMYEIFIHYGNITMFNSYICLISIQKTCMYNICMFVVTCLVCIVSFSNLLPLWLENVMQRPLSWSTNNIRTKMIPPSQFINFRAKVGKNMKFSTCALFRRNLPLLLCFVKL